MPLSKRIKLTAPPQEDSATQSSSSKNKFRPFKNILSFSISHYGKGTQSSAIRLTSPPLITKNYFFFSQFKYELSDYQFKNFGVSEFQKFSIFTLYKNQLSPRWKIISVLPFSFATQTGQSIFGNNGLSLIGSINLEKAFQHSTLGGGIVVIKRAKFLLIVPNFSFKYTPPNLKWQIRLAFPQLEWIYPIPHGLLTSFLKWDLNTYAIRPKSNVDLSPESKFINIDRIFFGFKFQRSITSWLNPSLTIGKVLNKKIKFSDIHLDRISKLKIQRYHQEEFFLNFNLAVNL